MSGLSPESQRLDDALHAMPRCPAVPGCGLWMSDYQMKGDPNRWGCLQNSCAISSQGGHTCIVKLALDDCGPHQSKWELLVHAIGAAGEAAGMVGVCVNVRIEGVLPDGSTKMIVMTASDPGHILQHLRGWVDAEMQRRTE